jgi:hypothetical protein
MKIKKMLVNNGGLIVAILYPLTVIFTWTVIFPTQCIGGSVTICDTFLNLSHPFRVLNEKFDMSIGLYLGSILTYLIYILIGVVVKKFVDKITS